MLIGHMQMRPQDDKKEEEIQEWDAYFVVVDNLILLAARYEA